MKKIKLSISGMHCASCSSNVERSLKKISTVNDVSVSAVTNKAFVEVEDSFSEEEIKKAVEKVGYKVLEMEQD